MSRYMQELCDALTRVLDHCSQLDRRRLGAYASNVDFWVSEVQHRFMLIDGYIERRRADLTITAGKGLKRSYTWEGATRAVEMWPTHERLYGSLGVYFPGPGEHWKEHEGITRGVVEEGQQHFKTADEAQEWLAGRKYMPYVYRDDGLVVGWQKVPARKQLNVEVWQIYINGKKPAKLDGSQDDKINVKEPMARAGKR